MNEQNETRDIKAEDNKAWDEWYYSQGHHPGRGTLGVWEACCEYKEIELVALRTKLSLVKDWSIASELRKLFGREES